MHRNIGSVHGALVTKIVLQVNYTSVKIDK